VIIKTSCHFCGASFIVCCSSNDAGKFCDDIAIHNTKIKNSLELKHLEGFGVVGDCMLRDFCHVVVTRGVAIIF